MASCCAQDLDADLRVASFAGRTGDTPGIADRQLRMFRGIGAFAFAGGFCTGHGDDRGRVLRVEAYCRDETVQS